MFTVAGWHPEVCYCTLHEPDLQINTSLTTTKVGLTHTCPIIVIEWLFFSSWNYKGIYNNSNLMLTEPALREWCRLEWPQRMCLQTIVFCFFLLVCNIIHFNEWSRLSGVEDQCLVTSLAVNLWTDSSWLLMVTALGSRLYCSCPGSFFTHLSW